MPTPLCRNSKTPTFELISGLMDAVKQEEVTRATFEIPFSKETHDQLDILKHIGRNARDPRVFSRKRKQKKSQDNLSNARSAKHSRRLRSGILGAPQQDSQSSLHHSTSGMHPMAPRFLKSPTGFKTAKGKEFVPEPIPASLSARYLKMKKREDYLRGSVEKESRLSSQSPRATKIEQLFASTSQHSGLNLPQGPSSIQHSYTLQHQLKMPKQKIGFSGLNSNSNPNIGMSAIASTSKHSTSRQKTATNKDQSVVLGLGNESASKSLKRQQNDASKKNSSVVPSAKRTGKSPSVQSNTSGKNLRLAAQVASESISSQSKLKLTSLFLSHLHSPTQAKSGKERRNTTNTTTHIDGGRMMRLTVTSAKNAAPLVQINNIVGEIKDTTQINKGVMNSSTLPNGPVDYSADGRVMQSQSSKQYVGGKLASQKRSRSKQSPSLEKQSIEMERTHLSPKQVRRVSQYDKQAIATYLQKNRLVNL